MAPATTKVSCFKRTVGQMQEWHSGVHRCFPGGGDSILSIFSWESLRTLASLQGISLVSWVMEWHDQPGCARALTYGQAIDMHSAHEDKYVRRGRHTCILHVALNLISHTNVCSTHRVCALRNSGWYKEWANEVSSLLVILIFMLKF